MKHKPKIILIILTMFILTQLIGLYVVNHYIQDGNEHPFIESPEVETESQYYYFFIQIILAFIIAIGILFLLIKHDLSIVIRVWFFLVIILALGYAFNSFLFRLEYSLALSFVLAAVLGYIKMFKRDILTHNLTEFFIYPGIASIFVPVLSPITIVVLLIVISGYDMWAVWKSGIMQKMAKYQMDSLKVFSGFYVPYLTENQKAKIKKASESKSKKAKEQKISVNVAILGGGDVIFPIVTAGVFLEASGIIPALFVIAGATIGLAYLFINSEKKKFYPAMPFITAGIFAGLAISYLFF